MQVGGFGEVAQGLQYLLAAWAIGKRQLADQGVGQLDLAHRNPRIQQPLQGLIAVFEDHRLMADVEAQRQVAMMGIGGLPVLEKGQGLIGVFQHAIRLHLQAHQDLPAAAAMQAGQLGGQLPQVGFGLLLLGLVPGGGITEGHAGNHPLLAIQGQSGGQQMRQLQAVFQALGFGPGGPVDLGLNCAFMELAIGETVERGQAQATIVQQFDEGLAHLWHL